MPTLTNWAVLPLHFRDEVNQLIAAGKINNDPTVGVTGQDLVNDANEAIACVQAAVAQSGITCPL